MNCDVSMTQFQQIWPVLVCLYFSSFPDYLKANLSSSLVARCLRILLPVQGTQVPSLVWEDCTCLGETKPTRINN